MRETVYLTPNIEVKIQKSPDGKEQYFHISMERIIIDLNGKESELLKVYCNLNKNEMKQLIDRFSIVLKEYQESSENTFKLNEFLSLKLNGKTTNIYVNNKLFRTCTYLLINIPTDRVEDFDDIQSIDEAEQHLGQDLHYDKGREEFKIDPIEEFRAHCSNMQAWVEHDYNTQILHRNLAFPLLKELIKAGDPKAKIAYKNELAYRLESNDIVVTKYLIEYGYLSDLHDDELIMIIENMGPGIGKITLMEYYNKSRKVKRFRQVEDLFFNDEKMALRINNKELYVTAIDKNKFPYTDYKKAFLLQTIEKYSRYLFDKTFFDFGITHEKQKVVFRTQDLRSMEKFFNNNAMIMVQIPRSRAPLKLYVESENTAIYIYPELIY